MDAQADLSLRWAHARFVGFVVSRLICPVLQSIISLHGNSIRYLATMLGSNSCLHLSNAWHSLNILFALEEKAMKDCCSYISTFKILQYALLRDS